MDPHRRATQTRLLRLAHAVKCRRQRSPCRRQQLRREALPPCALLHRVQSLGSENLNRLKSPRHKAGGYPRWTRAGGVVASSTGCWDPLCRGASDILTPWATRGRIDFSNARCPSLSIPRVLARPPACMLAMSPLGCGKTKTTLDFAWSLERAHTSAGRARCVHIDLVCTLLNGVLCATIVLVVHSSRQHMRRGVDQNSLPESNARCTYVATHPRPV